MQYLSPLSLKQFVDRRRPQHVLGNCPERWAAIVGVLAIFVVLGSWHWRHAAGDDLASSFVGSRLLIEGHAQHLFHFDPVSFAEIGDDDLWTEVAQRGGFHGYLHPYVHTPLWAYVLQPLCRHLQFPAFNLLFVCLSMLTFAASLWLVAKYWAPGFSNPYAMALAAALLAMSQPFRYAMFLNQTHMVMLFLTLVALLLAERDRPWLAGFLLAYAASVKVTPGLLVLYWLLTRRWKAATSTVLWSAAIWALTVAVTGHALTSAYLADLQRISRVLLVSGNNQSFAAWWMAHFYPSDAAFDIDILPLPNALRLLSTALMLGFTAWGGWLDRQRRAVAGAPVAPLGAMVALVAATLFAPIAWTHYSILLFVPLMLLADANRTLRSRWVWGSIAVIVLLNYQPVATDIIHGDFGPFSVVRGQFFAGVLTLATLAGVALRHRRIRASKPQEMEVRTLDTVAA